MRRATFEKLLLESLPNSSSAAASWLLQSGGLVLDYNLLFDMPCTRCGHWIRNGEQWYRLPLQHHGPHHLRHGAHGHTIQGRTATAETHIWVCGICFQLDLIATEAHGLVCPFRSQAIELLRRTARRVSDLAENQAMGSNYISQEEESFNEKPAEKMDWWEMET